MDAQDEPLPRPEPDPTLPLEQPDPDRTAHLAPPRAGTPNPARMPAFIGPYRILGVLGTGGMGVVYEAEQQSPHRRVALKVMRHAHLVTEVQAHQFKREVETLGRLKHPNVATIYESGQTDDGLDFYAMEMVQGATLDAWLAGRPAKLTPKEAKLRLRMFKVICEAVHYAHLRGVIHRDLKPANIMVLKVAEPAESLSGQADPAIKILDFGLARLIDPDGQAPSLQTEMGVIMGTLQYMSPEQARGDTAAIDLRTDIYALGMILYEMLAGMRPYELGKAALSEAVRVICEDPPQRFAVSLSGSRGADADLATIVGKSMEKEPDRRYPSAGALAEDVDRYLTSQPIIARPQSRIYRGRMFVRRHRFGVGAATAIAMLLVGFSAAMAIQARRIAREAAVSRRVSGFMTQMFAVSDPSEARGNTITAREILDKASGEIRTGLDQDPEIQARLMRAMGSVYFSLGLYGRAENLLEPCAQILRRISGLKHPETLEALSNLATVYVYQGRLKEADALFQETLPAMQRALGPEHPDTLRLMKNLAGCEIDEGRLQEAEALELRTVEALRRVLGPDHLDTLKGRLTLANVYHFQGRYGEALPILEEVLASERRIFGPDHPVTLDAMNNLGAGLVDLKRYPEAEALNLEALRIKKRVLGPEHPETMATLNNLANIAYYQGRYAESEILNREILRIERKTMGPRHPDVGNTLYSLACLRVKAHDRDGALRLLQEAVEATLPVAGAHGMATDTDLEPLHRDPRFKALLAAVERTYGRSEGP